MIEGVDPNILEKSLAPFEGQIATALRKLEEDLNFEGDNKDLILNYIALLAMRSPEMREHWRKIQADIAERIMDVAISTKEIWESQKRQMRNSGQEVDDSITYEEAKNFHERKQYTIEVTREHHIHMEFSSIEAILPYLDNRKWLLIKSTDETGPFITTDNPVNLTWKEPENIPNIYRHSPGYGMKNTQVYFPVSKNLALIGEFDGQEGVIEGTTELIAALNSKMLIFTYKQIYTPKIGFYFHGEDGELISGKQLLNRIGA